MSNWNPQDYAIEFRIPEYHQCLEKEKEYQKRELFTKAFSGIENGDMAVVEFVEETRQDYQYPEKVIRMRLNFKPVTVYESVAVHKDLSETYFAGEKQTPKSKWNRVKTSLKYIFDKRTDDQMFFETTRKDKYTKG
jgi:hypothetical protein